MAGRRDLVCLGALAGCIGDDRATNEEKERAVTAALKAYAEAQRMEKDEQKGVMTFFGLLGDDTGKKFAEPPNVMQKTSRIQQLLKEKELVGFFLTGHPLDGYKQILQRLSCVSLSY